MTLVCNRINKHIKLSVVCVKKRWRTNFHTMSTEGEGLSFDVVKWIRVNL